MKWLAMIAMVFALQACEEQGPLEKAGEEVDEAVQDIGEGGKSAGHQVDDAIDDVRKDIEDATEEVDPD